MGLSVIQLVIGFGFIVFIHELGHFLAAKYVGIKVEQFALGFGPAIFSWRKGLGFRKGSTEKELQKVLKAETDGANKVDPSKFGETEYRFNWIPLGGYVKMLGQDDTKPGLVVNDPRSYTSKSIGARMLVISAGVIMNIIFAGVAFMILFMTGMKAPQAVVGGMVAMGPAQLATTADGKPAPLQVGDHILSINGVDQHNDFKKIALNTALARENTPLRVTVQHVDGKVETVLVTPEKLGAGFLGIGISMPRLLQGPDITNPEVKDQYDKLPADIRVLQPDERITEVNGQPVKVDEYYKLDQAMQASDGKPVDLTITADDGKTRHASINPELDLPATKEDLTFAGMTPRATIAGLSPKSAVQGKAEPGDVVLAISSGGDTKDDPSPKDFTDRARAAGSEGRKISLRLLRGDKEINLPDLNPDVHLDSPSWAWWGKRGLGVAPGYDEDHAVVAAVAPDSPAAVIPAGSILKSVNGVAVKSWPDVLSQLRKADSQKPVAVVAAGPAGGADATYSLQLRPSDVQLLRNMRFGCQIALRDMTDIRRTPNPLIAASWGLEETRDSILQVYLTLRRLTEGSVPVSGIMGPLGMVSVGTHVARQGLDYLLWFLAIISANLAVVNFLPVPVVDGGHFLFLLIEKIQGKPLPEKAINVAQYIGLGLILSVFLLATYQDVLRMLVP